MHEKGLTQLGIIFLIGSASFVVQSWNGHIDGRQQGESIIYENILKFVQCAVWLKKCCAILNLCLGEMHSITKVGEGLVAIIVP